MKSHNIIWILLLGVLLFSVPVAAQGGKSKKNNAAGSAHTQDDSRAAAIASSRKTPDPFGFLKGSDNGQHKKNKDCACPGTKKGERQRRKEMRNHRRHR